MSDLPAPPPPPVPAPIVVIQRYLRGEIGPEHLRAAEAAWDPIERAAWLMENQVHMTAEIARLRARIALYEGEPTDMTVYVQSHRGDGTTVVVDAADNTSFVIRTTDWPAIASLPNEEQRARLATAQIPSPEHPNVAGP